MLASPDSWMYTRVRASTPRVFAWGKLWVFLVIPIIDRRVSDARARRSDARRGVRDARGRPWTRSTETPCARDARVERFD